MKAGLDADSETIKKSVVKSMKEWGRKYIDAGYDFSRTLDDISQEAKKLVREIINRLEQIPDGCAECFPFEVIDELKQEYY